jgi:hypothetical protein
MNAFSSLGSRLWKLCGSHIACCVSRWMFSEEVLELLNWVHCGRLEGKRIWTAWILSDGEIFGLLEAMELEEALGKLTDRMQIKREHGVTLLQTVLSNAGTGQWSPLFAVLMNRVLHVKAVSQVWFSVLKQRACEGISSFFRVRGREGHILICGSLLQNLLKGKSCGP